MAITKKKKDKGKIKRSNAKGWVKDTDTSWTPTAYKVPKGTKVFKFKEKKLYRLDIMGYKVGKGNPRCPDEGSVHFERTFYVHDNVGPRREKYPCLIQTFGRKKCPICDHVAKLYREGSMEEKAIKKMEPKMRHLWLVRDLEDTESGFQIMETGHYKTFGEQVKDKLDALDDDSPFLDFYMPSEGSTFAIKTKEDTFVDEKGASRTFFAVGNIDIVPRRKQYDDDVLDELPCLDELLVELSYEELKEKFLGEDDEDEDKPKKKGNKKTVEDEDDDEEDDDAPKSKKKKKGKADDDEDEDDDDDSDDDSDEGDGESDDSDDESDDEEEESEGSEDDDEDAEESEEIEVGDVVSHGKGKKKVEGRVIKIKSGKATVSDDDDEEHKFPVADLTLVSKAGSEDEDEEEDDEEEEKPAKKKGGKKPSKDDDDEEDEEEESDDEDDEDDEEEEKPKGKKKVVVTKKASKKKDDDEDEDSDDDDEPFEDDDFSFDEDEEEDEKPAKKKKKTG